MPKPLSVQLADAIVSELQASGLTPAFVPTRKLLPVHELSEFDTLRVTVIPRTMETGQLGRGSEQKIYTIDVGVQQRVGQDVEGDAANVMATAEAIGDYLRNKPLAAMTSAGYLTQSIDPIYSPEHLEEMRLATSVVSLRYTIRQ